LGESWLSKVGGGAGISNASSCHVLLGGDDTDTTLFNPHERGYEAPRVLPNLSNWTTCKRAEGRGKRLLRLDERATYGYAGLV
jgi:hypothetical protein